MMRTSIPVRVANDPSGRTILSAPAVGIWSDQPVGGAYVQPGSTVGTLTQLRRRFVLVVPDGVAGRVTLEGRPLAIAPVEYGETLLRVTPSAGRNSGVDSGPKEASRAAETGLPVVAPTGGVFYRSPAMGAKPYVAAGDRIRTGQPVGLIEVMKTFNPIAYGGAGFPEEAEIVDVLAADGQEVRAGQALVVVKTL
jgi:biotin carboxyl carrier protein